jgi:aspartyl-tRNA(Asn)/glutamyl-tRNA(Gln) amidotransferase subunit C
MSAPKITLEEVRKVAGLAQLRLEEGELEAMRADLTSIVGYVDQLSALDVEGVEPTTHAVPLAMLLRPDVVGLHMTREAALSNAPEQAEGMFRVPRIVEGGN